MCKLNSSKWLAQGCTCCRAGGLDLSLLTPTPVLFPQQDAFLSSSEVSWHLPLVAMIPFYLVLLLGVYRLYLPAILEDPWWQGPMFIILYLAYRSSFKKKRTESYNEGMRGSPRRKVHKIFFLTSCLSTLFQVDEELCFFSVNLWIENFQWNSFFWYLFCNLHFGGTERHVICPGSHNQYMLGVGLESMLFLFWGLLSSYYLSTLLDWYCRVNI